MSSEAWSENIPGQIIPTEQKNLSNKNGTKQRKTAFRSCWFRIRNTRISCMWRKSSSYVHRLGGKRLFGHSDRQWFDSLERFTAVVKCIIKCWHGGGGFRSTSDAANICRTLMTACRRRAAGRKRKGEVVVEFMPPGRRGPSLPKH